MPTPEVSEGPVASVAYLVTIGLTAAAAWIKFYFSGRKREEEDDDIVQASRRKGKFAILDSAELADMSAVRSLLPEMRQIATQLNQVLQIVQDNHRIIDDNNRIVMNNERMLVILQKLDRALDVEEEVKEKLREQQIEAILIATNKRTADK